MYADATPGRGCVGLALLLVLLAVSASSQTTPKPKPISNYMRGVGLVYIEQIEDFDRRCGEEADDSKQDQCHAALDGWDRVFQTLEDRIELTLSESSRPAGDKPYFTLLKSTNHAEHLRLLMCNSLRYHISDAERQQARLPPESTDKKKLLRYTIAYSNCHSRARADIKLGFYYAEDDMCDNNEVARKSLGLPPELPEPVEPPEFTGKEAEAHSWKTQASCEREGFTWAGGVCHAKSRQ
jgi:hypothetical protein